MKRTIRTILCAAAVVMAAVSCQKSIEPANPAEESKGTIDICVSGLMGEYTQVDGTKAELVNTVRVSWKGGETVYVYDGTQCLGSLAASLEGTEDRYAILSTDGTHTVSTPAAGTTTLTLVYSPLLTEAAPAVNDGAISISLASQSGEKTPFVAFATLDYTGTTIKNAVVPFQFATSVIKVNCTGLKANTAIDKATLSNVNTVCKLTLSGTAVPSVSGVTNGTITKTGDEYFADGKINSEGEAVFQIAVPALETASGARILTVAQGSDEVKDKNFSKKAIKPATSVNTVCQLVGLPAGALKGEFSVGPNATDKVHFSQGNLVATIDASGVPTAWKFSAHQYDCLGEGGANKTIGATAGDVDLFGWSTSTNSGTSTTDNYGINTSITDSDYSGNFYDWGKAVGDGNTWRTLTSAEWKYLFDSRSNASSLYKYGVTVCDKANCVVLLPDNWDGTVISLENFASQNTYDENSSPKWSEMQAAGAVCLPAAGGRTGSEFHSHVGDNGTYWSSSPHKDNNVANTLFINSQEVHTSNSHRYFGYSVRLITE